MAIYAPHGSFLILSRRFFEAGAVLKNERGIGGEELIVAETCRRLALPVVYEPSLTVLHNEHSTVGTSLSRSLYDYHKRALDALRSAIVSDVN